MSKDRSAEMSEIEEGKTYRESSVQAFTSRALYSVVSSPLVGVSRTFTVVGTLRLGSLRILLIVFLIFLVVFQSQLILEVIVES